MPGAVLRSETGSLVRSASGAFIRGRPAAPPQQISNSQIWSIGLVNQGWPSAVDPVPVANCAGQSVSCSTAAGWTFPNRPFLSQITPGPGFMGMGYEAFPFPSIQLRGVTSGHVVLIPEHCATNTCPWTPGQGGEVFQWASIPGAQGVFYLFADAPVGTGIANPRGFWVTYTQGEGNPWTSNEDVEITLTNSPNTLLDSGPFSILSIEAHPNFATRAVLNLSADAPYGTRSALYLQGTVGYDGMVEGAPFGDFTGQTADQLVIYQSFTGNSTGTVQRVYDQTFDSYWNDMDRIATEPPPSLPPPP